MAATDSQPLGCTSRRSDVGRRHGRTRDHRPGRPRAGLAAGDRARAPRAVVRGTGRARPHPRRAGARGRGRRRRAPRRGRGGGRAAPAAVRLVRPAGRPALDGRDRGHAGARRIAHLGDRARAGHGRCLLRSADRARPIAPTCRHWRHERRHRRHLLGAGRSQPTTHARAAGRNRRDRHPAGPRAADQPAGRGQAPVAARGRRPGGIAPRGARDPIHGHTRAARAGGGVDRPGGRRMGRSPGPAGHATWPPIAPPSG